MLILSQFHVIRQKTSLGEGDASQGQTCAIWKCNWSTFFRLACLFSLFYFNPLLSSHLVFFSSFFQWPSIILFFPPPSFSPPLSPPYPVGKAHAVVIVISYFSLIPASAASGHWLQNPLSFVYFNYANEDSSAGLLEAAGEKAGTPLRVITIHPLVSL